MTAIVHKGEKITCTNGHVIGECLEDLSLGSHTGTWGDCFGNWQQDDVPKVGSMHISKCAICGADFMSPEGFHYEDGTWKP